METVQVDGQRVAYRAAGSGAPLVLLHGGMVDGRAWRREIEACSGEFHVIAWNAPGCGHSSDPSADVALNDSADTVAALLDTLDVGPAHVLGHSFGGGLALAVHERHARRPTEEWVDGFLATLFDETTPRHLVDETREIVLDAFARADLTGTLERVAVPTLLLYGEKDQRSRRPVAEAMAAAIPTSRLVFLARAGHDLHVEAPDAFDHEIRSFLHKVWSDTEGRPMPLPRGGRLRPDRFEPERSGCRAAKRESSRARAVAGRSDIAASTMARR